MSNRFLCFTLSIAALAGGAPHSALSQRANVEGNTVAYRDWSVTCNNLKNCVALSVSDTAEGGGLPMTAKNPDMGNVGFMRIERASGPIAQTRVDFIDAGETPTTPPPKGRIEIVDANGKMLLGGRFPLTTDARNFAMIAPAQVDAFLRLARVGTHVAYLSGDEDGLPLYHASLSGFVASGRAIDAVQGRTNTVTAMVDRGNRPATTVPPAPALPVVTARAMRALPRARPPANLLRLARVACGDEVRFERTGGNMSAYALSATRTLWSVPCSAGAYNEWDRFYIQEANGTVAPVKFQEPIDPPADDSNVLVNANVDAAKGLITTFSKARGLGDCGDEQTLAWTGTRFVIAQEKSMQYCVGITSDNWPSQVISRLALPPNR